MQALLSSADPLERRAAPRHLRCEVRQSERFQWVTVCVRDAINMTPLQLQHATIDAYAAVRTALVEGPAHPIRFWNFIPDINHMVDHNLDRYMVFNAGRHAAYTAWHGNGPSRDQHIVTASGVGHDGDDLVIHCLAADRPGAPIENPRQTPAYRYSPRFGPFPPGFARATLLRGLHFFDAAHDPLMIGGTASIIGECTRHCDRLNEQLQETLINLAAVIRSAECGAPARIKPSCDQLQDGINDADAALTRIRSWRIYYVRQNDLLAIKELLSPHLNGAEIAGEVEWVRADLCRPDLLVEIEAVADIPCAVHSPSPIEAITSRHA